MNQLSALDVGVVVAYVLGTTLLGALFSRGQRDVKTYFVGDRNVAWWLVLVSIVATETSTVTFLSVPGFSYATPAAGSPGGNFTFLQLCIGYLIGRCVIAWFLLPQYFRGELLSAYQLLRQRFGPAVQRTASGLFLVTRTVADGLRVYLTALLLQQFTGWGFELSVLVMGAATILYTYLGGMQAVIWTDLIQFVVYVLGAVVALGFLVHLSGGWDAVVAGGEAAGKFRLFDLSTDPTNPYTLLTGVVGGALFTMSSHGADQLMVQRYLCARSLGQARLALVLSGVTVFLQFALFLLIGVGLYVFFRSLPGTEPRPDEAFGMFIVGHLPHGVIGLIVAAVLAAAMSTLSSSLNSSANAVVTDFYRPLTADRSDRHYLTVSRVLTLVFGVLQVGVALGTHWTESEAKTLVVEKVLSVAGLTTGLVLGLFILGTFRRPVRSGAALGGLVAGAVVVLAVWLPSVPAVERGLKELLPSLIEPDKKIALAWPWYAPVGTGTTVAVALLLNALGRRSDGPAPESADRSP